MVQALELREQKWNCRRSRHCSTDPATGWAPHAPPTWEEHTRNGFHEGGSWGPSPCEEGEVGVPCSHEREVGVPVRKKLGGRSWGPHTYEREVGVPVLVRKKLGVPSLREKLLSPCLEGNVGPLSL